MGTGTLNDTRRELGLDPVGSLEQSIRRADRVIFLTSEAFDFTPTTPGPARRVRRASPTPPSERAPVAWTPPWPQDGRPSVLLSLSTTYMQQEDLLQRLVDALGQVDCHALVTTGPGMRSRPLARVPSNVHVVESVPHGAVLPHVDLVITHGGHGTRDPGAGRRRAGDGRPDQPRPARQRRPRACTTGSGSRPRSDRHRRSSPPRCGGPSPTTPSTRTPATWPSGWRPTWVPRRPSPRWRTWRRDHHVGEKRGRANDAPAPRDRPPDRVGRQARRAARCAKRAVLAAIVDPSRTVSRVSSAPISDRISASSARRWSRVTRTSASTEGNWDIRRLASSSPRIGRSFS